MMMRTTAKKLAAATALAGMLIGIAPGVASAGPKDDFEIKVESKLPKEVTDPWYPIDPSLLTPTDPPVNTNARPIVDWVECYHDDYIVNFTDMDAPDLKMTVEIAFTRGLGSITYDIRTMYYVRHLDAWFITLPSNAANVVIQAIDQDGNFSHGITLGHREEDRHPTEEPFCNDINVNAFNNDRTTDVFELIGAR